MLVSNVSQCVITVGNKKLIPSGAAVDCESCTDGEKAVLSGLEKDGKVSVARQQKIELTPEPEVVLAPKQKKKSK